MTHAPFSICVLSIILKQMIFTKLHEVVDTSLMTDLSDTAVSEGDTGQ